MISKEKFGSHWKVLENSYEAPAKLLGTPWKTPGKSWKAPGI